MFMSYHLGIREKITAGFYMLLTLMIATGGLTYAITREVSQKVELLEVIDDFLNKTLEVRRFEKNYFLYNKPQDFEEYMIFWQELAVLLSAHQGTVEAAMTTAAYQRLLSNLNDYKKDMELLRQLNRRGNSGSPPATARQALEEKIRAKGKELTSIAETTSKLERQSIRELIQTTATVLLISIISLVVIGLIMVTFLGRGLVRSLKILEEQTRRISRGEFVAVPAGGRRIDPEINSLLQAFNRMTNELRLRQQQLVQSEKLASLGTLLSGVAHELNNPLSNISTSAQILAEEMEDDNLEFKRSLLDQIVDQVDRARDIVRSLLEFSRVREFDKTRLRLKNLVAETLILLRGQVPSEVTVNIDIPNNLEMMADKQRIQQVCLNLIKNAADAVGRSGHIWISARQVSREKESGEVEIMIEDDGEGIAANQVNKIFDPFFTTKDVGHGSGLGLFIVHDIIEWHGGSIQVDSRPGEGTTFIIWLPAN